MGTKIRLFDTASGEVRPLETREDGKVSMYVCGPTVYGPPHVGPGRQIVLYDILRRYLAWAGYEVRHVSNVTDIDDKIIDTAASLGVDTDQVARENEDLWWSTLDALGLERPHETPHATGYVDRMVEFVAGLLEQGVAYPTSDGVYLDVSMVEGYGLLALQDLDSLRAGARVEANEEKRSPLDFVLWKFSKPGEPTWPAVFGDGRPGWHTECVVMSLDLLGDDFDIHTGGEDLRFPHHENERAQAVVTGHRFARHWMHHAFVEAKGEKMSKSLGNVTNLVDVVDAYDPRAYKLLVAQSHYRSPMEVTDQTLLQAQNTVEGLDAFGRRIAGLDTPAGSAPDADAIATFRAAMDDDLDTPRALASVFELIRQANAALDADDEAAAGPQVAAVLEITGVLGIQIGTESQEIPAEILDMARRRDEARARKDFAEADALRDQIQAAGFVVEDTLNGTVVRTG
jgi:cysteinyl-tRNA synthetase